MSKITIAPEVAHPARVLVETAWLEQLSEDAQTAVQMLSSLSVSEQNSGCGKFVAAIYERVQDLSEQLGQIMEDCNG